MDYLAVLFDMDGVVVDTHESVTAFWERLSERNGIRLSQQDYDEHVYGCPASHTLQHLFGVLGETEQRRVVEEMTDYEVALSYQPVAGAIGLLNDLHRLGVPLALVTSGREWKVGEVTRQLGIQDVFAVVVTASDIRLGKPNPECYLLAARMLGIPPRRCAVFEDAASGVGAAVAAGALCVGVHPSSGEALLKLGACCVIPDFQGVSAGIETDGIKLRLSETDHLWLRSRE